MPSLDRRAFLRSGAAAALAGAGGLFARSDVFARPRPVGGAAEDRPHGPGFYRFRLGEFNVTVLGDGSFELPADIFGANATEDQRAAYYRSRGLPLDAIRLSASPAVIDTGNRLVLVDSGTGAVGDPPPPTGHLLVSLAAAGIAPEAIDLVILTHAHTDHIGGLVDPGTGALRFPNAEVVLSQTEHALWTAPDVERRVPAWVAEWGIIEPVRASFAALGERVRTVAMEGEVIPGLHSVDTAGHTPGHIGVLVASGGAQMLIVGDAIANAHTHFERLDWLLAVDHDPELGRRTRRRLLDRLATDGLLVQGFHLPFPGVGYVVREGRVFRWVAAT